MGKSTRRPSSHTILTVRLHPQLEKWRSALEVIIWPIIQAKCTILAVIKAIMSFNVLHKREGWRNALLYPSEFSQQSQEDLEILDTKWDLVAEIPRYSSILSITGSLLYSKEGSMFSTLITETTENRNWFKALEEDIKIHFAYVQHYPSNIHYFVQYICVN